MINHVWSALCSKSVIDVDTNTISMFDMIEALTVGIADNAPARKDGEQITIPINYEAVSYWIRQSDKETEYATLELEILDPKGKVLHKMQNKMEFKQGLKRLRSRVKMFGLNVTHEGIYKFIIKITQEDKTDIVAELPVDVNFVKNPTLTSNPIKN
jgi:hypothetical protein